MILLYPVQTRVLLTEMNENIVLVLLDLKRRQIVAAESLLDDLVNLIPIRWREHYNVQSVIGAYAANTVKELDTLCKSLAKMSTHSLGISTSAHYAHFFVFILPNDSTLDAGV